MIEEDLPWEVKEVPPDQRLDWLVQKYLDLTAKVARARTDATASAEYAVQAEDRASVIETERLKLLRGLKHLYQHLTSSNPTEEITTPGLACSEIHPLIKEYLQ